jgi:CBS domain-containing protein
VTNAPELLLSKIPKLYTIETNSQERRIPIKWVDFDLVNFDADYPRIKHFIFKPAQPEQPNFPWEKKSDPNRYSFFALPWDEIESIDWSTGLIRINNTDCVLTLDGADIIQKVFLDRDILDAYVIDLQNLRLTRANDILLDDNHGLRIKAADTGAWALFRRLSGGLFQGFREHDLQDWKYIEFLRGDPGAVRTGARYHRRIAQLPPGEIASLSEALPYLHATELILLLSHQLAADTLELLTSERQLQIFEELDELSAIPILAKMAPDIATDLIGRLTAEQARHYLDQLPKPVSERIIDLLRYPENSVGGIMTNDVIAIPGEFTISEARERLRSKLQDPDFVYFLYVIDDDENKHLRGVVTLRSILVARDDQKLEEIMNPYLATLSPLDSPRQAAYRLIKSQLAALPVVSQDSRLLGVVTVDAAVSLVAPGTWSSQAPRIFT